MRSTTLHPTLPAADTAARLDAILAAVEVVSPAQLRIGGGPALDVAAIPVMPAPGQAAPADAAAALESALATAIYMTAYAAVYRGGPVETAVVRRGVTPDAAFTASLSAANPTRARWEPGWRVFAPGTGGAVNVAKDEVAIAVQPGQYAFAAGAGRLPAVGDHVELLVARESLILQPGMYFAFGDTPSSDYDFASIARLYFHVPAEHAAWLLRTLASVLNRHFVPFRAKCSVDPRSFDRTDGFVLYLGRRFLPAALRLLAPLVGELDERLAPGTPLFSRPILAGVGGADDPGSGESFGQSRCRLVAAGLLDAWRAGAASPADRREAVERRFRRAGISPDAPHLVSGAADLYTLPTAGADA
jgi:hypothetical protein